MLKKRVIAIILVRKGIAVQSIGFSKYLPIGRPEIAAEYFDNWGADEIVLLDISATCENRGPDNDIIQKVAEKISVPLTVGGGIASAGQMMGAVRNGADKICINSAALLQPDIIKQGADILGRQCIVTSIDIAQNTDGAWAVYDHVNRKSSDLFLDEIIQKYETAGAGELLVQVVNRDGTQSGYEVSLFKDLSANAFTPVIAASGAGNPDHFHQLFSQSNVAACAAGNFFHFYEQSIALCKEYLRRQGHHVRIIDHLLYNNHPMDEKGRLKKLEEHALHGLKFQYQQKEVI
jgi:cyclase